MINAELLKLELVLADGYQASQYNALVLELNRRIHILAIDHGVSFHNVTDRAFSYTDLGYDQEDAHADVLSWKSDLAIGNEALGRVEHDVSHDYALALEVLSLLGTPKRSDAGRSKENVLGTWSALARADIVTQKERSKVALGSKHVGKVNAIQELGLVAAGVARSVEKEALVIHTK